MGMDGYRDPSLSPLEMTTFRTNILARATDLNCITRRDAFIFVCDLALQQRRISAMLLTAARLELKIFCLFSVDLLILRRHTTRVL
jgi:hypothetical protein